MCTIGPEREFSHRTPSFLSFARPTHLLIDLSFLEDILQCNVELAQVVLAEPIMIPTDAFQERHAHDGHLERDVPFRVEGLWNRWRRLSGVSQCDHQVLPGESATATPKLRVISIVMVAYRITCPTSVLGRKIPSL